MAEPFRSTVFPICANLTSRSGGVGRGPRGPASTLPTCSASTQCRLLAVCSALRADRRRYRVVARPLRLTEPRSSSAPPRRCVRGPWCRPTGARPLDVEPRSSASAKVARGVLLGVRAYGGPRGPTARSAADPRAALPPARPPGSACARAPTAGRPGPRRALLVGAATCSPSRRCRDALDVQVTVAVHGDVAGSMPARRAAPTTVAPAAPSRARLRRRSRPPVPTPGRPTTRHRWGGADRPGGRRRALRRTRATGSASLPTPSACAPTRRSRSARSSTPARGRARALALAERSGRIHGRRVDMALEDDQYRPAARVPAAQRCAERDPFLPIGTIGSDTIAPVREWPSATRCLPPRVRSACRFRGPSPCSTPPRSPRRTHLVLADIALERFLAQDIGVRGATAPTSSLVDSSALPRSSASGPHRGRPPRAEEPGQLHAEIIEPAAARGRGRRGPRRRALAQTNALLQASSQGYHAALPRVIFRVQPDDRLAGRPGARPRAPRRNLAPAYPHGDYSGPFALLRRRAPPVRGRPHAGNLLPPDTDPRRAARGATRGKSPGSGKFRAIADLLDRPKAAPGLQLQPLRRGCSRPGYVGRPSSGRRARPTLRGGRAPRRGASADLYETYRRTDGAVASGAPTGAARCPADGLRPVVGLIAGQASTGLPTAPGPLCSSSFFKGTRVVHFRPTPRSAETTSRCCWPTSSSRRARCLPLRVAAVRAGVSRCWRAIAMRAPLRSSGSRRLVQQALPPRGGGGSAPKVQIRGGQACSPRVLSLKADHHSSSRSTGPSARRCSTRRSAATASARSTCVGEPSSFRLLAVELVLGTALAVFLGRARTSSRRPRLPSRTRKKSRAFLFVSRGGTRLSRVCRCSPFGSGGA